MAAANTAAAALAASVEKSREQAQRDFLANQNSAGRVGGYGIRIFATGLSLATIPGKLEGMFAGTGDRQGYTFDKVIAENHLESGPSMGEKEDVDLSGYNLEFYQFTEAEHPHCSYRLIYFKPKKLEDIDKKLRSDDKNEKYYIFKESALTKQPNGREIHYFPFTEYNMQRRQGDGKQNLEEHIVIGDLMAFVFRLRAQLLEGFGASGEKFDEIKKSDKAEIEKLENEQHRGPD